MHKINKANKQTKTNIAIEGSLHKILNILECHASFTGINFTCVEHCMAGSYKRDWLVRIEGKPENFLWFK